MKVPSYLVFIFFFHFQTPKSFELAFLSLSMSSRGAHLDCQDKQVKKKLSQGCPNTILSKILHFPSDFDVNVIIFRINLLRNRSIECEKASYSPSRWRIQVVLFICDAVTTQSFFGCYRWDVAVRRCFDGYTSAGKYLGPRTFGHTGFTGMSTLFETIIFHSHIVCL